MRNKNFFVALLVIFGLICAYNIYFSYERLATDSHLGSLSDSARAEWWKSADNVTSYNQATKNSFSLGLDLQGGMFVTLEVGVDEVLRNLAGGVKGDQAFETALVNARKRINSEQINYLDAFVQELRKAKPNVKLAEYFGGMSLGGVTYKSDDSEIIAVLRQEIDDSIDNTFKIIRTRIDQFGVVSPNLQLQAGTNRILVELPGVKDQDRVRNLLRSTAQLEFWHTYTVAQAIPYLSKVNEKLKGLNAGESSPADKVVADSVAVTDKTANDEAIADATTPTEDSVEADSLDPYAGLSDDQKLAKFKEENPLWAVLSPVPQNIDPGSPVCGFATPADTAKVNAILSRPEILALLPSDMRFFWSFKPEGQGSQYHSLIALKYNPEGKAPLTGDVVENTRVDMDQNNQRAVLMNMNADGAKKWRKMTADAVAANNMGRSIAVVLDQLVYSYPTVQTEIANGSSQITGNFSPDEASDLANLLKAGKLEAPVRIEGEEIVGPSLGEATVNKGMISFFMGFLAVILFMLAYYRGVGMIADIALLINLFFLIGIISALNVVLTLPGIAGIVLTMGMAVDANVLIYERIREELDNGRSLKGAIQEGFRNAFSAIIDGNVTTLLTGIILYSFGTGPIRGFAITLIIGIITTLVTALFVTRILLEYRAEKVDSMQLGYSGFVNLFRKAKFDFIGTRKTAYIIAGVLALSSLAVIGTQGFKYGVDFEGGRQYIIAFDSPVDAKVETLRGDLTKAFAGAEPVIKTIGSKDQLMVTTKYLYGSDDPEADGRVETALIGAIKTYYPNASTDWILKSSKVGPTITRDIVQSAISAVIFSLIAMFLYIFARFRGWQFGLGTVVSLGFNVLVVLGLFSVLSLIDLPFSVELDQAFIAAILTIVGYTINDTVVVFDRIRERLQGAKSTVPMEETFNTALNETLSRTLVTSVTTLLTALILFFFGGDVLKGFMLALITGIVVGTFSTLFVASPISLDLILRFGVKHQAEPITAPTGRKPASV